VHGQYSGQRGILKDAKGYKKPLEALCIKGFKDFFSQGRIRFWWRRRTWSLWGRVLMLLE